jgi:hypothetical protein
MIYNPILERRLADPLIPKALLPGAPYAGLACGGFVYPRIFRVPVPRQQPKPAPHNSYTLQSH